MSELRERLSYPEGSAPAASSRLLSELSDRRLAPEHTEAA